MVNIRIDPKSLSEELQKGLGIYGADKVEARELPDGRVVLRRHYGHTIVSSLVSVEWTDAKLGEYEIVGEDTIRIPGSFYLIFKGFREEAIKARERKGV